MGTGKLALFVMTLAASSTIAAMPFPEEEMTGAWKMSDTFPIEVDPCNGTPPTETEQRQIVSLTFLGNRKCKASFHNVVLENESSYVFDYIYANGRIEFTKMNGQPNPYMKDSLFGYLRASVFNLEKKDDNTFIMKYADLPTLAKNWAPVGTATVEALENGGVKTVTTIKAGAQTIIMTERHQPMVFKRITGGQANAKVPPYRVLAFGRKDGDECSYDFKLEFKNGKSVTKAELDAVLQEIKVAVVEDYSESYSDVDVSNVFVDFHECKNAGSVVEGRVCIFCANVASYEYSQQTRRGKIVMAFNDGQLENAREYMRRNISSIARDKNIALVTGEIPPDATVELESDVVAGENTLEIHFKAVE